jgi:hypothetical protein
MSNTHPAQKEQECLAATIFIGSTCYKIKNPATTSNQALAAALHAYCIYNPGEPGQFYFQDMNGKRTLIALRIHIDELLLLRDIQKDALLRIATQM